MSGDMVLWYNWSQALGAWDWRRFYAASGCDYTPGYLYILWVLGKIQFGAPHAPVFLRAVLPTGALLYKLPAMAADVATVVLLYVVGKRWGYAGAGYLAALSYAFNPGIIFNSSRWGQVDSIPALFMVVALVLLIESRPVLFGIALALSIVCKPTALILVPLCLVVLLRRGRYKDVMSACVSGLVTVAVVFFPFIPPRTNPIEFIHHLYTALSGEYPFLTLNAFNLWLLVQGHVALLSDSATIMGVPCAVAGWVLLAGLAALACIAAARRTNLLDDVEWPRTALPAAAVVLLGFFILLTRMHERHLLPALPMLAMTCVIWPRFWLPYCWLSFAYFLNLRYVFYLFWPYGEHDLGEAAIKTIALVNVAMLGVAAVMLMYIVLPLRTTVTTWWRTMGEAQRLAALPGQGSAE
ncbi:MAG TPA: glycosyltransferase 87 family protein [Chloroflexota bacterium]|jgi:Gpi18-like mannosyltransferase